MIPRIKELLHSTPFSPFTVRTSDGRKYTVPTPDHAAVNPKGTYVVVFSDNDSHADVAGLHVAAVVKQTNVQEQALIAASFLSKFLSTILFGITIHDPVTFVAVPTCLITIALLAGYLPARRATRVDPVTSLRYE